MPHDVFISYSSQDKLTADAVCAGLESSGIRCWIAPRDILPGQEWAAAILTALQTRRMLILAVVLIAGGVAIALARGNAPAAPEASEDSVAAAPPPNVQPPANSKVLTDDMSNPAQGWLPRAVNATSPNGLAAGYDAGEY